MPSPNKHNSDFSVDEQLAQFTDRLLAGQPEDVAEAFQDDETRALTNTIQFLKQYFDDQNVDKAMQDRIQSTLIAEWKQQSREHRPTFFVQLQWQLVAITVVLLLIGIALFLPLFGKLHVTLPAAADANGSFTPIVILIGLLVGIALIWVSRKK